MPQFSYPQHLRSSKNLITTPIASQAWAAALVAEKKWFAFQHISFSNEKTNAKLTHRKFTYAIQATLTMAGIPYRWLDRTSCTWRKMLKSKYDEEILLGGISWQRSGKNRTLIFNLTVPLVKNNVDLCLFNLSSQELEASKYALPESYIALGELKGGIDPAGADEHWKTARTSLERIQKSFGEAGQKPHTFFIGTAIEKKMAGEIWSELKNGSLSNAANLNDERQIASVSRWLCTL